MQTQNKKFKNRDSKKKQLTSTYNFLALKLYFFFSQFNEKLYKYSKTLLYYSVVIASFMLIWIFGNSDYFGEFKDLTPSKVSGVVTPNNRLIVFSQTLDFKPYVLGYRLELWKRMTQTSTSKAISLCLLGYFTYLIVSYLLQVVDSYRGVSVSKAGIEHFKENTEFSDTKFEELVPQTDIVYESTLAHMMKGRQVGGPKVVKMHQDRLIRLNQNMVRLSKLNLYQINQKFITLSSYDYRVSKKSKKSKKLKLVSSCRNWFLIKFFS